MKRVLETQQIFDSGVTGEIDNCNEAELREIEMLGQLDATREMDATPKGTSSIRGCSRPTSSK